MLGGAEGKVNAEQLRVLHALAVTSFDAVPFDYFRACVGY